MIYILLSLLVLTTFAENISINDNNIPQWFLVKESNIKKLDLDILIKFNVCFSGNYIQKYHNETHCLVELYTDENCKISSGITYWEGQNIFNINNYVKEHSYISHIYYSDEQCDIPIQYFLYTKEHCNYEVNLNTAKSFYSWFDIQGNTIKYCNIEENTNTCTEEMKKDDHCQILKTDVCDEYKSQWFINYDKLDNGIHPMTLLLVFGVLMLFL